MSLKAGALDISSLGVTQLAAGAIALPQWSGETSTESQYLKKNPVPSTAIATDDTRFAAVAKPLQVAHYEVKDGDTLSGIAAKFSITTQSLVWANTIDNPNSLKPGSSLVIPPTSGVLHTIKEGETLSDLASKYHVSLDDIKSYKANGVTDPDALKTGQFVMVPGGVMPAPAPVRLASSGTSISVSAPAAPTASAPAAPAAPQPLSSAPAEGLMQWPTLGPIYTFFSGWHRGIDISPPYGTPIYAMERGLVVYSGNVGDGYGLKILVDHGNGYQTLYAHLSAMFVSTGEYIGRGQNIGLVGMTGVATGPHLHFEVWKNGVAFDPLAILPR